ncbi:MAG: bifunctional nuclease family protein [Bacteroidales bacterium]|nr:bifunctional nuclease family protein [Bacteroidales bacterium]
MKKVKLEIVGMSYSQSSSGAYALILGVAGENRRLPIIIGGFEAQAIAIELEKMKPTRPLTHDLFKSFADHFGIKIQEVVINKFEEGIFFSKLVCEAGGSITEIDSRTSDAVALAIRFNCPIYAYQDIIDEAAIDMEVEQDSPKNVEKETTAQSSKSSGSYDDFLLDDLKEMLKKAVAEERYEEASRLRDEINRRKEKLG